MAEKSIPKQRRAMMVLVGLFTLLIAAQLLFLPLPWPVERYLALEKAGWLLNESESPKSLPGRALHIFVSELVQRSITRHFHDRHGASEWDDDAAYAGQLLHKLRKILISQREVYHRPGSRSTMLSSFGWCDELNGAAGRLLALDFDSVEIVGVSGLKVTDGGHSFGRFWSRQHADWLYFDIWTEEVILFRVRPGADPEYLFRSRPVGPSVVVPDDFGKLTTYHARAKQGFVHVRYQSTLAAHIGTRLWNLLSQGSTMSREAATPVKAIFAQAPTIEPSQREFPPHQTAEITAYVEARLAHLSGNDRLAIEMYRRVARSDTKSSYGLASAKFLNRLTRSHPM